MRDWETNHIKSAQHLTFRFLLISQAYQVHCHTFVEKGFGGPAGAWIGRVRGEGHHRHPLALKTRAVRRDRWVAAGKDFHTVKLHQYMSGRWGAGAATSARSGALGNPTSDQG